MAKIAEESLYLKNGESWKKIINYSKGKFRIKLPQSLCTEMNYTNFDKEVIGNSEDEVNRKWKDEYEKWINAIERVETVIWFKADFQGALLKKENWENWNDGKYNPYAKANTNNSMAQGCWEFCHDDINFNNCSSLGLMLDWCVLEKKTICEKVSFKILRGRKRALSYYNTDAGKYTEIEWTQEREDFFLQLDESFALMIAKVYKALGDLTPEKLIQLTESNIKLIGQ